MYDFTKILINIKKNQFRILQQDVEKRIEEYGEMYFHEEKFKLMKKKETEESEINL